MTVDSEPPIGQRFSLIYQPKAQELPDSDRFRNRIFAFLTGGERYTSILSRHIPRELGLKLVYGSWGIDWTSTFRPFSIADFLDAITIVATNVDSFAAHSLVSFVRRVLIEEGIALRIDE